MEPAGRRDARALARRSASPGRGRVLEGWLDTRLSPILSEPASPGKKSPRPTFANANDLLASSGGCEVIVQTPKAITIFISDDSNSLKSFRFAEVKIAPIVRLDAIGTNSLSSLLKSLIFLSVPCRRRVEYHLAELTKTARRILNRHEFCGARHCHQSV